MSKKNIILSCLLVVLLVCSCMLMTACAKNYEVKWNVDDHATVAVEGSKKLPSKAEENSTITFTAKGKDGYQIASVTYKIGEKERPLTEKDGKYTVTVTAELEVIVKVEKAIESVSAALKSDAKTYYTGDELDPADVTVTAHYKTGDSEPVTNYSVNYASEDVVAFSRGDAGFTVTYKGVTSVPVTFASPVETKVVLDPNGGTISDAAIKTLTDSDLIHNVTNLDDGKVSFTFSNISEENAVALPVDVEFPEDEGGWSFKNWKSSSLGAIAKISNAITTSTELNAIYNVNISQIKKVKLELVEGVPYLKMDVEFLGNGTVYPYLYEGNEKISLKGDDVTAVKGEKTTISVPLTQLAEASSEKVDSYEDYWMDICVSTTIHGMRYSTTVVRDDETNPVDVGSMIHDDDNVYKLHYYLNDDGVIEFKVFFQTYEYTYSIDAKEVDGVPSLVIEGKINTAIVDNIADYANGKVSIGTWGLTGTIAEDGSWKIVAALKDIEMSTKVAGEIAFESADGSDYIEITANGGKLSIAACENIFPYGDAYGNPKYYYETKTFGIYEVTYGSDWNEPFLIVQNVDKTVDFGKFELVAENDTPYVIISGTYGKGYTVETFKEAIEGLLAQKDGLSIQQYGGDYPYLDLSNKVIVTAEDGKYSVKIDISDALVDKLYYLHVNNSNYTATDWTEGQSISVNGIKYTLNKGSGENWLEPLTCIWVKNADEVDPEFTPTAATLEEKDGAAYLVLTGTWNTANCEATTATNEIANIKNCSIQHYNSWNEIKPEKFGEANADGTFKVYLAIKDLTKTDGLYYLHFGTAKDVKVEGSGTLTIGNTTYTLEYKKVASDWDGQHTTITVTVAE